MGTIVAIGGGQVFVPCHEPETFAIDQEIVGLARVRGKRKPRVLFIPTASRDDLPYCNTIYTTYKLRLGCVYNHLRILGEELTDEQIEASILSADIIYVGGGNTQDMMNAWINRGIDRLLRLAYAETDIVLCGLSAGAICWFDWGVSDSESYSHPDDWKPTNAFGLDLIPAAVCPHFDSEKWRLEAFKESLRDSTLMGIALEDNAAIHVSGSSFRVLTSQPGKRVFSQYWNGDDFVSLEIPQSRQMQPIYSILNK